MPEPPTAIEGTVEPVTDTPPAQYVDPRRVLTVMGAEGDARIRAMSAPQIVVLGVVAGGFITMGALFSVLLGAGVEAEGPQRLVEGLGFSAGFFFVILSGAVLFTEANVTLPATIARRGRLSACLLIVRFWGLAWLGNLLGAVAVGFLIHVAQDYPGDVTGLLGELVDRKMAYRKDGGASAWGELILSGALANWLVGMAAFFAVMGRTLIGKYVPVFLAVTLFVSANFQHSPANMGYFSLVMPEGTGPGWGAALAWNIMPVGIGNILGGAALVVLPFWFALDHGRRRGATPEIR
ncbi:MAG: formate/nitrite transporter family protein [Thermoleophilia bacterium]